MNALRQGKFRLATLISIAIFAFAVAGCDDGDDGNDGPPGPAGADGSDGVACWDLNENGVGDLPDEDLNGDGVVDVLDCNALASGAYDAEALHTGYFTEKPYEGTQSCLNCHGDDRRRHAWQGPFHLEGRCVRGSKASRLIGTARPI